MSTVSIKQPRPRTSLLEVSGDTFRGHFNRRPFMSGHCLADEPLFDLERLVRLARDMPAEEIEYNAGNVPVSLNPRQTPRTGLSPQETLRRIAECQSWLVLKHVERDAEYRALLDRCLDDVYRHSEAIDPGMCQREGFVFISSPGSVTPYHIDPEHNFLLQIRGHKTVHICPADERAVLSEEELESFYGGRHRNLEFKPQYAAREQVFELHPGNGLYFPITAPHWVQNGSEVSISFSITFRTLSVERRQALYYVNHALRRRGWAPRAPGSRPLVDAAKIWAFRALRFGKTLMKRTWRRSAEHERPLTTGAVRRCAAAPLAKNEARQS